MRQSRRTSWARTLPVAVALAGVPAAALGAAPAQVGRIVQQVRCGALGTYQVGARPFTASAVRPRAGRPSPLQGHGRPVDAIPSPLRPWSFHGTLVIAAYSGCGRPTAGTFFVRRTQVAPQAERGSTVRRRGPCPLPPTGVLTAGGTFMQDAAHATDPLYVTVGATLTWAHPGAPRGRPCSDETGCPPYAVITSTVTMTHVTGYLQVPVTDGQTAILSFLPPAPAASGPPPTAVVLAATRPVRPAPVVQATVVSAGTVVAVGTAVVNGTPLPRPTAGPSATAVPAGGTAVLGFPPVGTPVRVRVGATILIEAGTRYTVSNVRYDPAILAPGGATGDGSPIVRAVAPGTTMVTATASPRCLQDHPACGLPSALLSYTIEVVSA
jgi:hypothetical protein